MVVGEEAESPRGPSYTSYDESEGDDDEAAGSPFVRAEGTKLWRFGEPYRFVGANLWQAMHLGAEGAAGVRLLLARGVDIDWKAGPHGQTHLHHAVLENNGDVARVLLLHGADIYCGDETGTSPLEYMRIGRCNHTPLGGTWRATTIDEVFTSYLRAYWKRLFAVTLGRKHDVPELGGQRIAPLIGSFVVGDVLVVKKK